MDFGPWRNSKKWNAFEEQVAGRAAADKDNLAEIPFTDQAATPSAGRRFRIEWCPGALELS
jgi:hypothetical protein